MKNIHILPTDKTSRIIGNEKGFMLSNDNSIISKYLHLIQAKYYNTYITNSEVIKEGDWVYYENGDLKGIHKVVNGQRPKTMILRKIIITTDQDLIKDGVQAIPDEFLEWFVKNTSCENVEIEEKDIYKSTTYDQPGRFIGIEYKIIIQKEEPKQETLEEAAIKEIPELKHIINTVSDARKLWINGAKWHMGRSYSEEEIITEVELAMIQGLTIGQYRDLLIEKFKNK